MKQSGRDIIPRFLVDSHYRLARYLVVILILGIITTSMVLSNISYLGTTKYEILEWITYVFAVFGLILCNICILVPRYLLKNRLTRYLFYAALLILTILFVLAYLQTQWFSTQAAVKEIGTGALYLNIISSCVSMGLLLAGSSAVMLFRYWIKSNRRINELKSITLQSELDLLKQQINPHFLFNMLNNANVLIWKNKEEAQHILFKLEDLLQYQLNEENKDHVLLTADIQFMHDFLNLEKVRRDKFTFTITREGEMEGVQIPSFLFIPFVENAVKHNQDSKYASYVYLSFSLHNNRLTFCCENSKPIHTATKKEIGGIGLKNIQRRLALLYPKQHILDMHENETTYKVTLTLNL
ncbi:histidine kinase [Parabacteroides sp. OttesenSCG-928-G06]|nr:histidine kinase [Parabacteroides sp. OttesenSCG-928-G06]